MDGLQSKISETRNKLIHMSNITPSKNVKFLSNRQAKIKFAEEYLGELKEFEEQNNLLKIESNYEVKIVNEDVFFRYLQKHTHNIIFDGVYVQAALCEATFILHLCTTTF